MLRILSPTLVHYNIARKFKGFKIHGLLKITSVNKLQVD